MVVGYCWGGCCYIVFVDVVLEEVLGKVWYCCCWVEYCSCGIGKICLLVMKDEGVFYFFFGKYLIGWYIFCGILVIVMDVG